MPRKKKAAKIDVPLDEAMLQIWEFLEMKGKPKSNGEVVQTVRFRVRELRENLESSQIAGGGESVEALTVENARLMRQVTDLTKQVENSSGGIDPITKIPIPTYND